MRPLTAALLFALASCAAPSLAYADAMDPIMEPVVSVDAPHPDAVDAMNALSADAPLAAPAPVPSAPAEAPVPEEAVAVVEDEQTAIARAIDAWFVKHFHGLGPHLTEFLHSRLVAAVEELKALLLELPIS